MSARRGKPFRTSESGSKHSRRRSPSPTPPPPKKSASFKIPKKTAPAVPTAFGRDENKDSSKEQGFERKSLLEEDKTKKAGVSSILNYAKDAKERKMQDKLQNMADEKKDPPVNMFVISLIDIFLAGGVAAFQGLWLSKEYEKLRRKRTNSGSEDEREPTEGEIRRQERLPKPGDFEFKEPILDWKTTKSRSDIIPGDIRHDVHSSARSLY